MEVKTFEAQYELIEFNHYIDTESGVSVVDLVVKMDNIDFVEKEFDNTFIIEANNLTYVFSGYDLNEYYEVGDNLIQVVCVK